MIKIIEGINEEAEEDEIEKLKGKEEEILAEILQQALFIYIWPEKTKPIYGHILQDQRCVYFQRKIT